MFGFRIALVGPMIGMEIYRKLMGGKIGRTGLAIPIVEYIPYQIMNPLTRLLAGYDCDVNFNEGKRRKVESKRISI